jgi:hypothetical protein
MENVEKIKEATMQGLLKMYGLLMDECAAQEKRIFDLEDKVAALSSQLKKKKGYLKLECPRLEPAISTFKEFDFPHGRILKLKNVSPYSRADYAIVAVKRFYSTDNKLECYAFYVHEKLGLNKLYIADKQAKNIYSKPSRGFENYIFSHVGLDLNQGWKIASGLMAFDEVEKLFQLAESIGYWTPYTITSSKPSRGCSRVPVHGAHVNSSFERTKRKS